MNLKPIKKGNTWVWQLKFWQDAEKTTPLDVSGHTFSFVASNSTGAIITLNDASFVETDTHIRTVTLSSSTTGGYTAQELSYQLDITLPSGVVEEWMSGYVKIEA